MRDTWSFIVPDSRREKSSNWLTRRVQSLRVVLDEEQPSYASMVHVVDSIACSAGPRINVSGVLNSWDTFAKNRDFSLSYLRNAFRLKAFHLDLLPQTQLLQSQLITPRPQA